MNYRNCPVEIYQKGDVFTIHFKFTHSTHRCDKHLSDDAIQLNENGTCVKVFNDFNVRYNPSWGKKLTNFPTNLKLKKGIDKFLDITRMMR